jgi:hypothetical protein
VIIPPNTSIYTVIKLIDHEIEQGINIDLDDVSNELKKRFSARSLYVGLIKTIERQSETENQTKHKLPITKILVEAGVDINYTVLTTAVKSDQRVFSYLISCLGTMESSLIDEKGVNLIFGYTTELCSIQILTQLIDKLRNHKKLKQYLTEALTIAASKNDIHKCQVLLDEGAEITSETLDRIVTFEYYEVLDLFIDEYQQIYLNFLIKSWKPEIISRLSKSQWMRIHDLSIVQKEMEE